MSRERLAISINRPLDDVFTYAAASLFKTYPDWGAGVVRIDAQPSAVVAPGASAKLIRQLPDGLIELTLQVESFEPPTGITITAHRDGVEIDTDYRFRACGPDVTEVVTERAVVPPQLAGRLPFLRRRRLLNELRTELVKLKSCLEKL